MEIYRKNTLEKDRNEKKMTCSNHIVDLYNFIVKEMENE